MVVRYNGQETIHGKTVLVTGANSGIGKETALDLARRGGRIILGCRNMEKGELARKEIIGDTKNESVILKQLDLSSFDSIQKFCRDFNDSEPRLDILINNAGVMSCPKTLTADGLEMQLGTNHFGHFLLTNLLLVKLKASSPSRIINMSSKAHGYTKIKFDDLMSENSYSPLFAYCQSKLANLLHALELSKRLEGSGVTINCVHPGFIATGLQRHYSSGFSKLFMTTIRKLFFNSPEIGAQTTLYCALSPELEGVSGRYFAYCKELQPSSSAQDEDDAKKLWDMTEEIIQQKLSQAAAWRNG